MIEEDLLENQQRQPGEIQTITWGELTIGHIYRDEKDFFHWVVNDLQGWVQLKSIRTGELRPLRRPSPETPVDIYIPSEEECLILLDKELGARLLRDAEEREHSIARRLNWRVEPVAASAKAMRDHIDMLHGVKVDDVVRKWQGTEAHPSDRKTKAAALAELRQAHDEMHDDHGTWPMAFPHIHTLEKETS